MKKYRLAYTIFSVALLALVVSARRGARGKRPSPGSISAKASHGKSKAAAVVSASVTASESSEENSAAAPVLRRRKSSKRSTSAAANVSSP